MRRGITVRKLQRFNDRWTRIAETADQIFAAAERAVQRGLTNRGEKFEQLRDQAVADRQAAIRVMTDEITELVKL